MANGKKLLLQQNKGRVILEYFSKWDLQVHCTSEIALSDHHSGVLLALYLIYKIMGYYTEVISLSYLSKCWFTK